MSSGKNVSPGQLWRLATSSQLKVLNQDEISARSATDNTKKSPKTESLGDCETAQPFPESPSLARRKLKTTNISTSAHRKSEANPIMTHSSLRKLSLGSMGDPFSNAGAGVESVYRPQPSASGIVESWLVDQPVKSLTSSQRGFGSPVRRQSIRPSVPTGDPKESNLDALDYFTGKTEQLARSLRSNAGRDPIHRIVCEVFGVRNKNGIIEYYSKIDGSRRIRDEEETEMENTRAHESLGIRNNDADRNSIFPSLHQNRTSENWILGNGLSSRTPATIRPTTIDRGATRPTTPASPIKLTGEQVGAASNMGEILAASTTATPQVKASTPHRSTRRFSRLGRKPTADKETVAKVAGHNNLPPKPGFFERLLGKSNSQCAEDTLANAGYIERRKKSGFWK